MPALRSVNKVILVGNLTRDAEVNYTPSGTPVCSFTVATNRSWKNASGEYQDEASFHRVSAWGSYGENLSKILKKGIQVYIEGTLSYREQRDSAGKFLSRDTNIRAEQVVLLTRSSGSASGASEASSGAAAPNSGSDAFDLDEIAKDMDEAKKVDSKASDEKKTEISDDDLPF